MIFHCHLSLRVGVVNWSPAAQFLPHPRLIFQEHREECFEHGALEDCDWITQQVTRSETAQPRGPKQFMPYVARISRACLGSRAFFEGCSGTTN